MFSANISVCGINVGVGETMLERLSLLPDTTVEPMLDFSFNSFFVISTAFLCIFFTYYS